MRNKIWVKKMYAAILNKKIVLAVSEAGLVNARRKVLNQDNYRCPHCNKKVILVISEKKSAFFKHFAQHNYAMGEKEEHHQAKMLLKSALTAAGFDAQVEVPLAQGQLRADVLASEQLAFEVQCAPLSANEFQHRHALYKQIGIKDIWIVGQRHYLKSRLKRTQLIFFRKNANWGNYYLEINPRKNQFCLKYNIWQEPITSRLRYQTRYFSLDEIDLAKFWRFKAKKINYAINAVSQKRYLSRQIAQKTKLGLKIAELLYQQKKTLTDLPESVFTTWRNPGEEDSVSKFLQNKTP